MKKPGFQLVASLIAMVMIANLQYAWTLFVGPIRAVKGWQQSEVQGAFALFILLQTFVQPLDGWLIDRLGPRRTAFAGAAGYGVVVMALAVAGPAHLVPLGAAFGVVHGIVFPALMALMLGHSMRAERPRLRLERPWHLDCSRAVPRARSIPRGASGWCVTPRACASADGA